jgi:hypothetical protein
MKGRQISYSQDELDWVEARKCLPRRDLHAEFCAVWRRGDVSLTNLNALCKRRGWLTGRNGGFERGQSPANKGQRMSAETRAKCQPTMFKKGTRCGKAQAMYKPIGSERVTKDGYLERKVNDDMPFRARWRLVHAMNWEAAHGPIPAGYALKCLTADKSNTAAENWLLVPRAMLPRLAGSKCGVAYDSAPPELRPTILAIARLDHEARKMKSEAAA